MAAATEETPLLGDAATNDVAPINPSYLTQGETTTSRGVGGEQSDNESQSPENAPVSIFAVVNSHFPSVYVSVVRSGCMGYDVVRCSQIILYHNFILLEST